MFLVEEHMRDSQPHDGEMSGWEGEQDGRRRPGSVELDNHTVP